MAAPSSKHNKDPKAKIEMRSKLKYNIEYKMSRIKVGKEFEENKDQIKNNIMKILLIIILMIVSMKMQFQVFDTGFSTLAGDFVKKQAFFGAKKRLRHDIRVQILKFSVLGGQKSIFTYNH